MTDSFAYDVFLSHSAKDKDVVRTLAERLKADNIRVWFDEWVMKPGESAGAADWVYRWTAGHDESVQVAWENA